jgi:DNA polymerase I-like protein with 3'-5' exonuclease and polymerase domains
LAFLVEVMRLREMFFGSREPSILGADYADLEMRIMAVRRRR